LWLRASICAVTKIKKEEVQNDDDGSLFTADRGDHRRNFNPGDSSNVELYCSDLSYLGGIMGTLSLGARIGIGLEK
jgi:hypothetical protein